jgi:alkylation response protein AidB-like acyl-CoA dehydrogenase
MGPASPQVEGRVCIRHKISQIYEGTNQGQRIVMARQLLAGVRSVR